MKKNIKIIIVLLLFILIIYIPNYSNSANTYYQYMRSGINAFPESYQSKLRQLSNKYPNWKFQAYYTGIPWDELIEKERDDSVHRNRVTVNAPQSWKHCGFVDDGWACASDAAVKYYLDPRNFLNETQIFQFVETSYNSNAQTLSTIQNSVRETFLDDTVTCKDFNNRTVTMSYSEIIIEAARRTNVSAFYIKSKIIQEVGIYGSGSVTGSYPGYKGYYNFFNYGAYDDGDDIANGLSFAKEKGWDSQYKAIIGGAELIGTQYINQGQNTAYFNKWDVVGTSILKEEESQTVRSSDMFWHQYMTNIQDPNSQSYSYKKLYANSLGSEITFIIPVYENMPSYTPMPQDINVTGIKLNQDIFVVNIDGTGDVIPEITPSNATNKDIDWRVSNSQIVRVWNGHFRGLAEGTTTVSAITIDGNYSASCKIIVRDPNKKYVQKIQIEKEKYISYINEALDISYSCYPVDSENTDLYWTTDKPEIIRVYGNRYRGLKEGKAKLIAITDDGKVRAESDVIIRDPNKVYVDEIELEKEQYIIEIDQAQDIIYTYTPQNAENAEFYWTSSNNEVLRVWGNRIRGLKEGVAEIIVKTLDETAEARVKVVVRDPNKQYIQEIIPEREQYTVNVNDAVDILYRYTPENAENTDLYWTSSNGEIIRVWGNRFRALKEGTAEVIVKTTDGTVEKRIQVIVKNDNTPMVQKIIPEKEQYTANVGEAVDIEYTYTPEDAQNAEFYWTSSNEEIIRVWGNRFRALKEGTAEVIVKTTDGTVEKRIKVTIKNVVKEIIPEKEQYTANVDEAVDIEYTYTPEDAQNAEFYWTASDEEIIRVWGNRFRALKEGTAEVIVKTVDGTVEKRIPVEVKSKSIPLVQEILPEEEQYIANVGEAVDIKYTYTPEDAQNAEFYWTSSNEEIIRVWGNRFRAIKEGTAEVIVKTTDGTIEKRIQVIIK